MSLIQEYRYQVKVLDNADFQVITKRLAALLDWMESQPEIKKLIDALRSTGRGVDLVGKLYRPFDPLHPEQTIASQVEQWLEDKGMI